MTPIQASTVIVRGADRGFPGQRCDAAARDAAIACATKRRALPPNCVATPASPILLSCGAASGRVIASVVDFIGIVAWSD